MIYIYLNNKNQSSIPFVVYLSVAMSVISLIISFVAFIIATTSILSNRDMHKLKESWVISNYSSNKSSSIENPKEKEVNEQASIQHRIEENKSMLHDSDEQKDNFERMRSKMKIDFHQNWEVTTNVFGLETSTRNNCNFRKPLDNEILSQSSYSIDEIRSFKEEEISYDKIKHAFRQNQEQLIQNIKSRSSKKKMVWYKPNLIKETKLENSLVPKIKNFNLAISSHFKALNIKKAIKEMEASESQSLSEDSSILQEEKIVDKVNTQTLNHD